MLALIADPNAPLGVSLDPDRRPPAPAGGELLIRPRLAGICSTDLEIARGYMAFTGVLGHEFVGVVESGPDHLIGQRVVGEINCPCGDCDMCRRNLPTHCRHRTVLGIAGRDGAFAEYLTLPARNCHIVPETVSDRQAVFTEPLAAAVQVVRQCPIDHNMRVAVIGSGRLGVLIAQVLALQFCRPTVIGRNPASLALCKKLGLQTDRVSDVDPAGDHDVVVEATGSPDGLRLALDLLRPRGTLVLKSTYAEPAPINLAPVVIHELRIIGNRCGPFPDALRLLEHGKIETEPLISLTLPLSDAEEAFAAAARPDNMKVLLTINETRA